MKKRLILSQLIVFLFVVFVSISMATQGQHSTPAPRNSPPGGGQKVVAPPTQRGGPQRTTPAQLQRPTQNRTYRIPAQGPLPQARGGPGVYNRSYYPQMPSPRQNNWRRFSGEYRGGESRFGGYGGRYFGGGRNRGYYGGLRGYGGRSHGWGHGYHSWSYIWFLLFGFGYGPPPWYWDPFYWDSSYYGAYWGPWFGRWGITYCPYPYYPYYPYDAAIGYCGRTGVKFDTGEITDSTDKKIIRESEVYVDGSYAGIVKDFDGRLRGGLRLGAGNHNVEVRLPNNQTFTKEVDVRQCQVTIIHIPQPPHPATSGSATQPQKTEPQQEGKVSKQQDEKLATPTPPITAPGNPAGQSTEDELRQLQEARKTTADENARILKELDEEIQKLQQKAKEGNKQ